MVTFPQWTNFKIKIIQLRWQNVNIIEDIRHIPWVMCNANWCLLIITQRKKIKKLSQPKILKKDNKIIKIMSQVKKEIKNSSILKIHKESLTERWHEYHCQKLQQPHLNIKCSKKFFCKVS